jgi:hypothetical protein
MIPGAGRLALLKKNEMQMSVGDNKTAAFYTASSTETVLAALKSRLDGLVPSEVRLRLVGYGANTLPKSAQRRWYVQLASNFVHLLALLLWVGAFLAWLARICIVSVWSTTSSF